MKIFFTSMAKLGAGGFFILTSVYCALSWIPYTYLFLVKQPPMHWLVLFIGHHATLYLVFLGLAICGYWPLRKDRWVQAALAAQALLGIISAASRFVPTIKNDGRALVAAFLVLAPALILALRDASVHAPEEEVSGKDRSLFSFPTAALAGSAVALVSIAGSLHSDSLRARISSVPGSGVELAVCVLVTYLWLAMAATFRVNVPLLLAQKKSGLRRAHRVLAINGLIAATLYVAISEFLQNSLTFHGWAVYLYSAVLALTVTALAYSVLLPVFLPSGTEGVKRRRLDGRLWVFGIATAAAVTTIATPRIFGEADWNGVFQGALCLLLCVFVTLSIFLLRPQSVSYNWSQLLAVAVVAGSIYWGTMSTAFLWARDLGVTQGAVSRSLDTYADDNLSFSFARQLISGGGPSEPCGEVCQTLRQYSNIRDAVAPFDLRLVDTLERSPVRPPDIYMIVIDSARPDYIGAYNPKVDFTPNLDGLARDSFTIKRAYTQYAGTTLSEAALWSGALLLHAHYMRPFNRVNNLEKLLRAENYQMAVSYDSILQQIVPDSGDLIKFDGGVPWNKVSISASLRQLEDFMEGPQRDKSRPLFFYAQPLNVHQFYAVRRESQDGNWKPPSGFHERIARAMRETDDALGEFIRYLKAADRYDNSIIVITSDHGEATGEFGRNAHSTIIFPEVMHVPLIIHLPKSMRSHLTADDNAVTTLTDVTPTLFYLLGHRPLKSGPFLGRPLLAASPEELRQYPARGEVLLASDVKAAYGLLTDNGHFLFTIYDAPLKSELYDLRNDPNAIHDILTDTTRAQYHQRLMKELRDLGDFYQYHPAGRSIFTRNDCLSSWC